MRKPSTSSKILLLIFTVILSACNYPVPDASHGISAEELRQTLAAPPEPVQQVPASPPTPASPAPSGSPISPTAALPAVPLEGYRRYTTRPGDTLAALAGRFEVSPEQIRLPDGAPDGVLPGISIDLYLPTKLALDIPITLANTGPGELVIPDGALVYSPLAAGFNLAAFVQSAGGYLSTYTEEYKGATYSGAALIQRVADELSVDPRLLLALLELRSGWVYGERSGAVDPSYPIGFAIPDRRGLYQEIQITATQLNVAYYAWRAGNYPGLRFKNGANPSALLGWRRPDPALNAGSVAVQHLLAFLYPEGELDTQLGEFRALYTLMFGDPWAQAAGSPPLIPYDLVQPILELPFTPGQRWSLTAGPHNAWNAGTPRSALDFAPVTGEAPCVVSTVWVTAAATGVIARAANNAVVLDLDGDGFEQTGWTIVYFHLAGEQMIAPGTQVALDERLGHPSCEGGRATGTHVHVARKYNGEWLPADGPAPFTMSGWQAQAEARNYYGYLVKGNLVVSASPVGNQTSIVVR